MMRLVQMKNLRVAGVLGLYIGLFFLSSPAQSDSSDPLAEIQQLTQEALEMLDVSPINASTKADDALIRIEQIRNNGYLVPDTPVPIPRKEVMGYEMEAYYVLARVRMESQAFKDAERYAKRGLKLAESLNEYEFEDSFDDYLEEIEYRQSSKKKGLGRLLYSVDREFKRTIVPEVNKVEDDVNRKLMINAESKARESLIEGNKAEAGRHYLEAQRFADKLNDSISFLEFQNKVISLYMELGRYEEAREMAESENGAGITSMEIAGVTEKVDGDLSEQRSIVKPGVISIPAPASSTSNPAIARESIRSSVERESKNLETNNSRSSRPSLSQQLAMMEASLKSKLEDSLQAAEWIKRNEQEIQRLTLDSKFKQLKLEQQEFDLKQRKREISYFVIGLAAIIALALLLYILFFYQKRVNRKLHTAYEQLKSAQLQLVESEKMASLGQLTAGVAHEINNPVNFISGNVLPLRRDMEDVFSVLDSYEKEVNNQGLIDVFSSVEERKTDLDIQFVKEEIQQLLEGIEEGAFRTAEIVKELRNFARMDEASPKSADIHQGLDSTLALLKHKTQDLELTKSYGSLPPIICLPGKLNQVFMNLLTNSIQAGTSQLHISTRYCPSSEGLSTGKDDFVEIVIKDNGKGISPEILPNIFDPFYTTKDVGEGTGLGLSISKGIIEQHNGKIHVQSELGKGTEITLTIPVRGFDTETSEEG